MERRNLRSCTGVAVLLTALAGSACGGTSTGTEAAPLPPTAAIYDEFLQSRELAARLTAPQPGVDAVARERQIVMDRQVLRNLEAGVASKRALLADAKRDAPVDGPNESLYFQIWSGHFGDGDKPLFRRLPAGGIEYGGKQFTKDSAVQCAVPSRLKGYTHQPFLECLSSLQTQTANK